MLKRNVLICQSFIRMAQVRWKYVLFRRATIFLQSAMKLYLQRKPETKFVESQDFLLESFSESSFLSESIIVDHPPTRNYIHVDNVTRNALSNEGFPKESILSYENTNSLQFLTTPTSLDGTPVSKSSLFTRMATFGDMISNNDAKNSSFSKFCSKTIQNSRSKAVYSSHPIIDNSSDSISYEYKSGNRSSTVGVKLNNYRLSNFKSSKLTGYSVPNISTGTSNIFTKIEPNPLVEKSDKDSFLLNSISNSSVLIQSPVPMSSIVSKPVIFDICKSSQITYNNTCSTIKHSISEEKSIFSDCVKTNNIPSNSLKKNQVFNKNRTNKMKYPSLPFKPLENTVRIDQTMLIKNEKTMKISTTKPFNISKPKPKIDTLNSFPPKTTKFNNFFESDFKTNQKSSFSRTKFVAGPTKKSVTFASSRESVPTQMFPAYESKYTRNNDYSNFENEFSRNPANLCISTPQKPINLSGKRKIQQNTNYNDYDRYDRVKVDSNQLENPTDVHYSK